MATSIISAIAAVLAACIAYLGLQSSRTESAAVRAKIEGEVQTKLDNLQDDIKELKAGQNQMASAKEESHRKFETDMANVRERLAIVEYRCGMHHGTYKIPSEKSGGD